MKYRRTKAVKEIEIINFLLNHNNLGLGCGGDDYCNPTCALLVMNLSDTTKL